MARPIILSNGSVHVGINKYGLVHDFYYPYVGQENHDAGRGLRHKIGVWADGEFSWLDDETWNIKQTYEGDALLGTTVAHSEKLGVTLEFLDCVDSEYDAFMRAVSVTNHLDRQREIRLFLHQVFRISNSLGGDTVQYLPGESAILHYKGHRAFIVSAENHKGQSFDQYACGMFGIEGKDGTFCDAEDGELSNNNVEHGTVDSTLRLFFDIESHGSARGHYWVACGKSHKMAATVHREIIRDTIHHRQNVTEQSWRHWMGKSSEMRSSIPKEHRDAFSRSLMLTRAHVDARGGVLASSDTTMLNYSRDTYAYCWPRDGAYALWPLLRLDYRDELQRFFEFCRRGLSSDGFLMHKYQPDGAIGSSWHPYVFAGKPEPPIQEDETALVLFLTGQYYQQTEDTKFLDHYYDSLIKPMAQFLTTYIDHDTKLPHPSYDLWEEKFLTSTYTTSVVYAALNAAAELAEKTDDKPSSITWRAAADDMYEAAQNLLFNKERGFFYKGFRGTGAGLSEIEYDDTIDMSSFYGAFMFGLFPLHSEAIEQSYKTLCEVFGVTDDPKSVTPLPRYEHDRYNAVDPEKGNPWFITTLWLAQYYLETSQDERAHTILRWVQEQMLDTGVLAEQINPHTGEFVSVAPLTWSQSEFMNAVLDLAALPMQPKTEKEL